MDKKPAKSKLNSLIFHIRGHNVMLDSDLAKLYDIDTKKLKQQVRRNIEIMRAFVSYRAMLIENKELRNEIIRLDKKINNSFKFLLKKIDELKPALPQGPRKTVGFKRKDQS